jgi:hypothetical protein
LDGFTPGFRVRNHSRFPGVVFRFLSPPFREFYRTRVLTVASPSCNRFCFLDNLDLAPIMGRRLGSAGPAVSEREEELIGLAILSIAATATLHDTDETKCFGFSDSWRNGVVVDSVCLEILKSYRQPAVVVAAVMRKLDLDPVDNASSRKRKVRQELAAGIGRVLIDAPIRSAISGCPKNDTPSLSVRVANPGPS